MSTLAVGCTAVGAGSLLLEKRVFEDVRAAVVQVGALLPREVANTHAGVDATGVQTLVSDLRNDDELLVA